MVEIVVRFQVAYRSPQLDYNPSRSEGGAILPIFAMYSFLFVTIVAVTVNSFFIGEAVVQHRFAVESFTLAAAKLALDNDEVCADKRGATVSEKDLLTCVYSRARVAGKGKRGCDKGEFEIEDFDLNDASTDAGENNSGRGKDDFSGAPYESTKANVQVAFGSYDKNIRSFVPATRDKTKQKDQGVNAIKMKVSLPLPDIAEVAPLAAILKNAGVPMPITFTSYAIAYRATPTGPFQLAIDPDVSS